MISVAHGPLQQGALTSQQHRRGARHENAALLSTLQLLRAEALELQGRPREAQAVRLDSLGWARYGYGADWAVATRLAEVRTLTPLNSASEER